MEKVNEFLSLLENELNEASNNELGVLTFTDSLYEKTNFDKNRVKSIVNRTIAHLNQFQFNLKGVNILNISQVRYKGSAIKVVVKINSFEGKPLTKPLEIIIADKGNIYLPQISRSPIGSWYSDGDVLLIDDEADEWELIPQAMTLVKLFVKLI